MRNDMIRRLEHADQLGRAHRKLIIFVFRSEGAIAIYVRGRRIYQRGWNYEKGQ